MSFNIIRADITTLDTDAIVNAANSQLIMGGGVCGAIFKAAGAEELTKACRKIGYCETGSCVITKGYNLKAKYIIHSVGPIYGSDSYTNESQLYSCYKTSLDLARKKRLKSIAFPLISSGIYGYPKEKAINIATKAIIDFLTKNEMQVYLVIYDNEAFEISETLFSDIQSYIDERMVVTESSRFDPSLDFDNNENIDNYTVDDSKIYPATQYGEILHERKSYAPKKKSLNLGDLLNKDIETFSQMLLRLIDEKGMTDVEVYKRANIDRKLFSKIRKKDYTPKKSTVMALIIALKLDKNDAKKLLSRAGFAFSECNKSDIIIEYFIEKGNYDIFEINETLFAFEQQTLGA